MDGGRGKHQTDTFKYQIIFKLYQIKIERKVKVIGDRQRTVDV